MATVGSLFINVKAKTASFRKKMKGVRSTIGRMASGFVNIAKKAAKFAAVLAGIALAAIVAMTKAGLKSVDALAKLAQTIASSVASIQVLQHMAVLGGVSIEKMDKAVSKMVRGIGEASMGIGTATDALKELGLSADDLSKMRPEIMFGVLADAIVNFGNRAKQGSLAYDIFGRAGQELLVTMDAGSEAVDNMSKKLSELGILIGDEQAQMVEKANDAWSDVGLVWKSLGQWLAVYFAPILEIMANRIVAWVKAFGGMGQVARTIVKAFMYVGATVLDIIKTLKIAWHGFVAAVLTTYGVMIDGTGIAVTAIVNTWQKGIGLMKTAAGGFLAYWGKGMEIISDKLHDTKLFDPRRGIYADLTGLALITGRVGEAAQQASIGLLGKGITQMLSTYKSEFGEFLRGVGQALQDEGVDHAEKILDLVADGWAVGKVPDAFKTMLDNAMGKGFADLDGDMKLDLAAPSLKGIIDNLQTAIGAFKVEGSVTERQQGTMIQLEKSQLGELSAIRQAVTSGGGALT